jgi:hypothetical protein
MDRFQHLDVLSDLLIACSHHVFHGLGFSVQPAPFAEDELEGESPSDAGIGKR